MLLLCYLVAITPMPACPCPIIPLRHRPLQVPQYAHERPEQNVTRSNSSLLRIRQKKRDGTHSLVVASSSSSSSSSSCKRLLVTLQFCFHTCCVSVIGFNSEKRKTDQLSFDLFATKRVHRHQHLASLSHQNHVTCMLQGEPALLSCKNKFLLHAKSSLVMMQHFFEMQQRFQNI